MPFQDLPAGVFQNIIGYAIPDGASELVSDTFQACEGTHHLQRVNKMWRDEVKRQLYLIRPLRIRFVDLELFHNLMPSSKMTGSMPDLIKTIKCFQKQRTRDALDVQADLQRVPLHEFRRIHVHFNPLLAPVNIPRSHETTYFETFEDESPSLLRKRYRYVLELQAQMMADFARIVGRALEAIENTHMSFSSGRASFHVFLCNQIEDSKWPENVEWAIPCAPVRQLNMIPYQTHLARMKNSLTLFPATQSLPRWAPADVLNILEHFNSIFIACQSAAYPTFAQTIDLPRTLMCLRHDANRSPAWHHNYWRHRFRHAFERWDADDQPNRFNLGADDLRLWTLGRTHVQARGWGSEPRRASAAPRLARLVLRELERNVLWERGCKCLDSELCCFEPAQAGCEGCVACTPSVTRRTPRAMAEAYAFCAQAYEVAAPSAPAKVSSLACQIGRLEYCVERSHVGIKFVARGIDANGRGEINEPLAEFAIELKALEFVARDWWAEMLMKAIPSPSPKVPKAAERMKDWMGTAKYCRMIFVQRHRWRKELVIEKKEYEEDVEEARSQMREVIELFTRKAFDQDDTRDRMNREKEAKSPPELVVDSTADGERSDADVDYLSKVVREELRGLARKPSRNGL